MEFSEVDIEQIQIELAELRDLTLDLSAMVTLLMNIVRPQNDGYNVYLN